MVSSETLRRFSLLAELEPAFLEEMSSMSRDKTVAKGEWLFHEGDNAAALYLIIGGGVDLKLKLDEKRNIYVTLTMLREGDVLGWSALVEPYIYSLGAMASDDTQLLGFDAEDLRVLLEKRPEQGYILMRSIAQAMATRVNILSERVPGLTWRSVVSGSLFVLGIVTGIFVLVAILSVALAAINGSSGATQAIPVALFCLMFPIIFLVIASVIYPTRARDNMSLPRRSGP
jgi:hypothetical protein